jgi:iron(III) transport system substrate-binding protein
VTRTRLLRGRAPLVFLAAAVALLAGVLPGASGADAARFVHADDEARPATAREWAQLVARAKREGSVVIYSSQSPTSLAEFAAKFKAKYGIDVTINRQIDTTTVQQVTTEHSSGRHIADFWIVAARPYVLGALRNGWVADATGPALFGKRYDRSKLAKPGKAFVVGTAIASFAWNTQRWPGGLRDFTDVLDSDLGGGRLGVVRPGVPGHVDFWRDYLGKKYGANFVTRLAALKPKLYVSSFPLQNALAAGEVAAAVFVTPQTLDLKTQGAPVDFRLTPGGSWNSPWWGMILRKAPHPAAAQLLANYMVTPEGQAAINKGFGAVMRDIPGTYFVPPRVIKLSDFTPKKVSDYITYWNSLFT